MERALEATKSVLSDDEKNNSHMGFTNVDDKNTPVLWDQVTKLQRHIQASACLESTEDVVFVLI